MGAKSAKFTIDRVKQCIHASHRGCADLYNGYNRSIFGMPHEEYNEIQMQRPVLDHNLKQFMPSALFWRKTRAQRMLQYIQQHPEAISNISLVRSREAWSLVDTVPDIKTLGLCPSESVAFCEAVLLAFALSPFQQDRNRVFQISSLFNPLLSELLAQDNEEEKRLDMTIRLSVLRQALLNLGCKSNLKQLEHRDFVETVDVCWGTFPTKDLWFLIMLAMFLFGTLPLAIIASRLKVSSDLFPLDAVPIVCFILILLVLSVIAVLSRKVYLLEHTLLDNNILEPPIGSHVQKLWLAPWSGIKIATKMVLIGKT